MSKKPIDIPREYGEQLPSFSGLSEATDHYERYRQAGLKTLASLAGDQPGFSMDYSPESLKSVEGFYFSLIETGRFSSLGVNKQAFEGLMGINFGAVATRNDPAVHWIVQEFAFAPGKYELGVAKATPRSWSARPKT